MAGIKELQRQIQRLDQQVENVIKETLLEYAQRIYNDAMSSLPSGASSVAASFKLQVTDSGLRVVIWTENEIAAYIEFGTGDHAERYLMSQEDEVLEEATKFFVSGEGNMPARPYLFPAYDRYKFEIPIEIDRRIQKLFDNVG